MSVPLDPVTSGMKFYDNSNLHIRPPIGAIFVFGSNLAGRHGLGSALHAFKHHGAIYGQGIGLQGNSYGIPTKDASIQTLQIELVETYVEDFVRFTRTRKELHFYVVAIGTMLAGYRHGDIAPLFRGAERCWFPLVWKEYLV